MPTETTESFRHEALLYAGRDDFLDATSRFIVAGAEAGEPTLVVVAGEKIDALRTILGGAGGDVMFADMSDVGANPGRIIPAWRAFVDEHVGRGRRLRGIGEPVWAERDAAELLECQRHETLLNLVFADAPAFWLLCPYDTTTLDRAVIEEAERSHPFISAAAGPRSSHTYAIPYPAITLDAPLPEPATPPREFAFRARTLGDLRTVAAHEAARAGLLSQRIAELVLAVNELATNSVRHAGGAGRMRIWRDADAVVCEVSDGGRVTSPLVDRQRPGSHPDDGRGLWLVNQLCDLVQLRSTEKGTTVRLHMLRV